MHRITFPAGATARSAAYAADGKTIFVHLSDTAINVWDVLCYYWPELLGGVCGLVLIVCTLLIRRTLARKRLVGEPHCRRCNYCLKGAAGPRCTECGHAIRRPVIGRPMWRRVLPKFAPVLMIGAAYGWLWAAKTPRSGYVGHWFHWWSPDLHAWSTTAGLAWLTARGQAVDRVIEFDAQSGRTLRTLYTQRYQSSPMEIAITPDGRGLLIPLQENNRLAIIDIASGRVLQTLQPPQGMPAGCWQQVAGFDPRRQLTFVVAGDGTRLVSRLLAWNTQTGESSLLREVSFPGLSAYARVAPMAVPRFYRIPHASPDCFLQTPGPEHSITFGARPAIVTIGGGVQTLDDARWGKFLRSRGEPLIAIGGEWVYLASSFGVVAYDSGSGRLVSGLPIPFGHVVREASGLDASRRWLVVNTSTPAGRMHFVIADLGRGQWIGQFNLPKQWSECRSSSIAPDATSLAALGTKQTPSGSGAELVIFDMKSLPHDDERGWGPRVIWRNE